ncbi:MAG: VCBS repeat-containing protein [Deltaproteobacteria bacterium]|nr:VCBS repeat-containing protein [Deltaproteobacteria bacterium]
MGRTSGDHSTWRAHGFAIAMVLGAALAAQAGCSDSDGGGTPAAGGAGGDAAVDSNGGASGSKAGHGGVAGYAGGDGIAGSGLTAGSSGAGGSTPTGGAGGAGGTGGSPPAPTCTTGTTAGAVQAPVFVKNLSGETSWFAPPLIADLDGDSKNELIAAYYSVFVYDSSLNKLDEIGPGNGRVYAPHVVADIDGDKLLDVVFGNDNQVFAYDWKGGKLTAKPGWPADTTTANNPPEVRGLAAADLDGDGKIEIVATTTQTAETSQGGAQVFVFSANGSSYQPAGITWTAWPRYNNLTGTGNDADRNGAGHDGYGCYGLNVGIGNIDDDPQLEILVTYDNHQIQAFDHDGVAINSAPWFTNPAAQYLNQRMTWGQFIRWADPKVEQDHYHDHTGQWPNPSWTEWLQWTASPPSVVDLDGDGKNEVVGVPNVELHDPYETQAYAVVALQGAHGAGDQSAMRAPGWETFPRGDKPISVSGWYPPSGVPAPAVANILGDANPEIVVSLNDGYMYAFGAGKQLWRTSYTLGKAIMFASEPTIADLNQDGSPEILFTTFGDPNVSDSGHLLVLDANGAVLHDVALPNPGNNGNGNGAPAAPTVGDLDGDGLLEIFVQTFDHGMDVFRVPGSASNCVLWSTSRGGPMRSGRAGL